MCTSGAELAYIYEREEGFAADLHKCKVHVSCPMCLLLSKGRGLRDDSNERDFETLWGTTESADLDRYTVPIHDVPELSARG
jgi:hypothetical protein